MTRKRRTVLLTMVIVFSVCAAAGLIANFAGGDNQTTASVASVEPVQPVITGKIGIIGKHPTTFVYDTTPIFGEPVVSSIQQAAEWVHANIKYDYAKANNDDGIYLTPRQVFAARSGVCRDMCILTMRIVKDSLGIKPNFVSINVPNTPGHAIVEYNGHYFDPTNLKSYTKDTIDVDDIYSYDEIMTLAEQK